MTPRNPTQNCKSMTDFPRKIDASDEALIDMLDLRVTSIHRAADLKPIQGLPVPDPIIKRSEMAADMIAGPTNVEGDAKKRTTFEFAAVASAIQAANIK